MQHTIRVGCCELVVNAAPRAKKTRLRVMFNRYNVVDVMYGDLSHPEETIVATLPASVCSKFALGAREGVVLASKLRRLADDLEAGVHTDRDIGGPA